MINKSQHLQDKIYILGLIMLAVGIPLSNFLMSISQLILTANFVFDKNLIKKIKVFIKNKAALAFISLFIIHLIGLIYSNDFNYALKDLRTKLPILVLPLIISTSTVLDRKEFYLILHFFIVSVFVGTLGNIYVYLTKHFKDIREISIFISHIRFSLCICLSISILFYNLFIIKIYLGYKKIIAVLLLVWFIVFLFILQSLTGIVIFFVLLFSLTVYYSIKSRNRIFKTTSLAIISILIISFGTYILNIYNSYFKVPEIEINNLPKYTKKGNKYLHKPENKIIENGNYLWLYISPKELQEDWSKRSSFPIDSNDKMGQPIINTLLRYLNSKGLTKDAEGLSKLNDKDIKAIEDGFANYKYVNNFGLETRILKILFEFNSYQVNGSIDGHSVFQRIELWKAALGIIKKNLLFGVGTGDMVTAYEEQLRIMDSQLYGKKLRSHNQFLSILSALGIIGFIVFFISLFYPAFYYNRFKNFYFTVFFIIIMLSMINEDTIESQSGVTIFTFFYILFLFYPENRKFYESKT